MIRMTLHARLPVNWFKAQICPPMDNAGSGLRMDNQRLIHLAFHQAYARLTATHPVWVSRGFDDRLLHSSMATWLRNGGVDNANLIPARGAQVALAWDRQFGLLQPASVRIIQLAELTVVANSFLRCLTAALNDLQQKNE